jgi:hypothetical protein
MASFKKLAAEFQNGRSSPDLDVYAERICVALGCRSQVCTQGYGAIKHIQARFPDWGAFRGGILATAGSMPSSRSFVTSACRTKTLTLCKLRLAAVLMAADNLGEVRICNISVWWSCIFLQLVCQRNDNIHQIAQTKIRTAVPIYQQTERALSFLHVLMLLNRRRLRQRRTTNSRGSLRLGSSIQSQDAREGPVTALAQSVQLPTKELQEFIRSLAATS